MKPPKQQLRPARYIGQTADENRAKRRAEKGLPPKPAKSERWRKCDDCDMPCSPTEYEYNNGLCAGCVVNS